MRCRTYLGTAVSLGRASILSADDAPPAETSTTDVGPTPDERILSGTEYATDVFVRDAPDSGPTVMVFGGMHGDEPCGVRAARRVAGWSFDRGTVVAVPRANAVAVRNDRRDGDEGDLNRQFPAGKPPTTRLARGLWEAVERHDPDAVIDLHRSRGLYGAHQRYVGQAVFPTDADDAVARTDAALDAVNAAVVPWYMPFHKYDRGSTVRGGVPMLVHKVAADLNRAGYIVETTNYLLDLDTRIEWTTRVAEALLAQHGVERRDEAATGPEVSTP